MRCDNPVARELAPAGSRSGPQLGDCYAVQREQAPSPQFFVRLKIFLSEQYWPHQPGFFVVDWSILCVTDFTPETAVPTLTAREVYQQLRDAAQGIRAFERVDQSPESGHVRVDIDGWRLVLDVDDKHLRHCLHGQSPEGREWALDNGQRFGTDPVSLLSTWELAQIERLLG
ncbi:hypothetical protein D3C84_399260 [compost metagenome]